MPLQRKVADRTNSSRSGEAWPTLRPAASATTAQCCRFLAATKRWSPPTSAWRGIHFRREWHPPDSVGHRCLARGLSDIAAMGGIPRAAFLSLALPAELPQSWVDEFIAGLLKLASDIRFPLPEAIRRSRLTASSPTSSCSARFRREKRSCARARGPAISFMSRERSARRRALDQLRDGKKLGRSRTRSTSIPSRELRSANTCARRSWPRR